MAALPRTGDTIAAVATAPGRGGVGIVRLSGSRSTAIAAALGADRLTPRRAHYRRLREGEQALDDGIAIFYPSPASFTGEDVVELQCHGSPVQLQAIIEACCRLGARPAEPGEFSQRAFLEGKIDLVQAEAIADLIASGSNAAARSALRSLTGEFSRQVGSLREELIRLRVFIEAAIDFPEEEIDFIADSDVEDRLAALSDRLNATLEAARRGRALRDGIKLVLAGAPNAGKSSLLNRLTEQDSAIVTDIPGTTRDVLRETVTLDGLPLHIVDTAGLRDSADAVEREGIRRARAEMQSADRLLLVIDHASATVAHREIADSTEILRRFGGELPENLPVTVLYNKCDLSGHAAAISERDGVTEIFLSALTGDGISLLRQHLLHCAGLQEGLGEEFSARQRHIAALEETAGFLDRAKEQLQVHQAAELVADDLRRCQDSLGSITGEFTSDDLLGEIFSSFCIGK
jgi:tRNA modification GTPase